MKRILVIGCPGSGKTTFSLKLSKQLNIPCIHLDKLFWKNDWVECSKEEFDNLLDMELQKESWIMDGNYSRTLSRRLQFADTVIYLDYPRLLCIYRVLKRVIQNYGKTRIDMAENCPEKFDFEFLKYIWNFNKINRKIILDNLNCLKTTKIFIVKNKVDYKELYDYFNITNRM